MSSHCFEEEFFTYFRKKIDPGKLNILRINGLL